MKRKIKLRGELVIIMLISLVSAFSLTMIIRNCGIAKGNGDVKARETRLYNECLNGLETKLKGCNLNNAQEIQDLLQNEYSYLVGYTFHMVDQSGKIIATTQTEVDYINPKEVVDGMRNYSVSTEDSNVFKMKGCDYLKGSYYLYYSYLRYDQNDTGMVAEALIGSLICFFILIWPRISYISVIRSAVGQIAKGDLAYRVPCKYKNELRELADGINQMAASLENEEQKKNEFLTNISHDIRTPLTTILGYLEMLKKGKYDSKEEMAHYINIMERKGNFLAGMLEDFFQYSKLESGDVTLELTEFELNEMLRQFYEEEEETFREKNLELKLTLYKAPILCTGDIQLLTRVVSNLLSNAIRYSRIGTKVTVSSILEEEDNISYGVFTVSNVPAVSISEKELRSLFERLYKRDMSRNSDGSGLGLSIARNIVKLHGGFIKAEVIEERLQFKVYLKCRPNREFI